MEQLTQIHKHIMLVYGPAVYLGIGVLVFIAIVGQWLLYYKCDLPGYSCLVPIMNVIMFMKIVGRPAWQSLLVIIPFPLIIYGLFFMHDATGFIIASSMILVFVTFMTMVYVELCRAFHKKRPIDYALCLIFNGFYVMYLGLSEKARYYGPAKKVEEIVE